MAATLFVNPGSRALLSAFVGITVLWGTVLWGAVAVAQPAELDTPPRETEVLECLVLPKAGSGGRVPFQTDPVFHQNITTDKTPKLGEQVLSTSGDLVTWKRLTAGNDGWFKDPALRGGYAYLEYSVRTPQVLLLVASGHSAVHIDGVPRGGDPYGFGIVRLPIELEAGNHKFLFRCGRGRLRVRFEVPEKPVQIGGDPTLPDFLREAPTTTWAAMLVTNATAEPLRDLRVLTRIAGSSAAVTALPVVPPYSVRKVGFRMPVAMGSPEEKRVAVQVQLFDGASGNLELLDTASVAPRLRSVGEVHRRTFVSAIDGSVQYYAVRPAAPTGEHPAEGPALFLSLHGASVEAQSQARSYAPKSWGHVVAPTNRRPFGFDWEDWGRLDALEVLDHAQQALGTDSRRAYLTGHSMGGHGTWQLGVLFPDRFAAIAPSAGWVSFRSYAGTPEPDQGAVEELIARSVSSSDTLAMKRNLLGRGVYILHGDADDNVPVSEARTMQKELAGFHHAWNSHEQPGAGHWWNVSDEPGADCVDWAPMFDLFAHHRLPAATELRTVEFVTPNPQVTSRCHWLTIQAQRQVLLPASARITHDSGKKRYRGTTSNVARLSIDVPGEGATATIELDGSSFEARLAQGSRRLHLQHDVDGWKMSPANSSPYKNPRRYGPFKMAFQHRPILVYGTAGSGEETAWARNRARFDAETFWYRGNGAFDVIPDTEFDPEADRDRSVVLYGNADTHRSWTALLSSSPVTITRKAVRVGDREETGPDLACLFIRPRPGSDRALVAVVGGTGLAGMKITERLGYFVSGIGYPDVTVIHTDALLSGTQGVRAAGYFGLDWSVDSGEFAWRD